jgi:hypothetical protein
MDANAIIALLLAQRSGKATITQFELQSFQQGTQVQGYQDPNGDLVLTLLQPELTINVEYTILNTETEIVAAN